MPSAQIQDGGTRRKKTVRAFLLLNAISTVGWIFMMALEGGAGQYFWGMGLGGGVIMGLAFSLIACPILSAVALGAHRIARWAGVPIIICNILVGLPLLLPPLTGVVVTLERTSAEARFTKMLSRPLPDGIRNLYVDGYTGVAGVFWALHFCLPPGEMNQLLIYEGRCFVPTTLTMPVLQEIKECSGGNQFLQKARNDIKYFILSSPNDDKTDYRREIIANAEMTEAFYLISR